MKKRGFTVEAIKKRAMEARPKLTANLGIAGTKTEEDADSDLEKFEVFQSRMFMRVQKERDYCISHHKDYHAVDQLWDSSLEQVNPILLHSLLDSDPTQADVANALSSWGMDLSKVIQEVPDPKNPNATIKRINTPAFFEITIPLVKSIVTMRLSKLMNDRRVVPFLNYNPAVSTIISRLQCEVISDRIEVMAQQYGYFEAVKQAVFQMLIYSVSFMFPVEEWHSEVQEVEKEKDSHYSEGEGDKKRYYRYVKEGVRYYVPHPAKTFFNRAHKASTINTDTGVDYLGHIRIVPFGEVRNNEGYYNQDSVSVGDTSWWGGASTYFNAIFGGCVVKTPQCAGGSGAPVGNDREANNAISFYSASMDDQSVTLIEYFEKLVPKDIGIGDYECPVWTRWVLAGDGTIVYGAPILFQPGIFFPYDIDDNRERNASLAMEIAPFQKQFSNLMSQYILTVKQNLTNVTFVDQDAFDENTHAQLDKIENLGQMLYQAQNWIRYSGQRLKDRIFGGTTSSVDKIVHSHRFQQQDTNGLLQSMRTLLEIMDRCIGTSAAESGQAASHELRKDEVAVINDSTSNRLRFTGIPVDDALDTMARQLYQALIAYGEVDFTVSVSHNPQITPELLEKLGFYMPDAEQLLDRTDKKFALKVKTMDSIMIDSFAGHRDSIDRTDNGKVAMGLAQAYASWFTNPQIAQAVGGEQMVDLLNRINSLAGMPKDFVLKPTGIQGPQEGEIEELKKEFAQAMMQAVEGLKKDVMGGIQPILEQISQQGEQIMQLETAVKAIIAKLLPQEAAAPIQQIPQGPAPMSQLPPAA